MRARGNEGARAERCAKSGATALAIANALGLRQIQPLTRARRVAAYCTAPPIKDGVSPYYFVASSGEAVMQRCIYKDFFGCAHAAFPPLLPPPPPAPSSRPLNAWWPGGLVSVSFTCARGII